MKAEAKQVIKEQGADEITKTIQKASEEAFITSYQPVNEWGEKFGEKTTLRDAFKKNAIEWWSQKVDYQGKPSESYSSKPRSQQVAELVIKDIVSNELRVEMDKIIKESKVHVRNALGAAMTEFLQDRFK